MNIWKAILLTIIYCIISFLVFSILITPKYFIEFKNGYHYFWILSNIITQLVSYFIFHKIFIKRDLFSPGKKITNLNLHLLFLIAIGELIVSVSFIHINDFIFSIPDNHSNSNRAPLLYFILRIIKGCLIAPLIEELLFRGFIQKKLNEKYSASFAIFFASMLFSLSHFDLKNVLPALLLGVILGFVFYKANDIRYPIYLHSISNFLVYCTNYYWEGIDVFFNENRYNISYWTVILVGLIILLVSLRLLIRKIQKAET